MRKRKQYAKSKSGGFSHLPTLIAMIVALVTILWGGRYLSQMIAEGFVPEGPSLDSVALEDKSDVTVDVLEQPSGAPDITEATLLSRQLSRAFKRSSLEILDIIAKGQTP